jgi:hypothetical protein
LNYRKRVLLGMLMLPATAAFAQVTTLAATSFVGPAFQVNWGRNYIAWTGTDNRLNIGSYLNGAQSGAITLPETSYFAPSLTSFAARLCIGWTGTDTHLNVVCSSSDWMSFPYAKVTLPDTSHVGLALATDDHGRLFMAWTGPDGRLNVSSSSDGIHFKKVTLGETSNVAPALGSFSGKLYLAWTGTDGRLNISSSLDGTSFTNKVTLPETSYVHTGPALGAVLDYSRPFLNLYRIYIAWTGTDNHLNVRYSSDGIDFPGYTKVTLPETSDAAPAVGQAINGSGVPIGALISWTGTDRRLNFEKF